MGVCEVVVALLLGGAALALFPGVPALVLDPALALAPCVAPTARSATPRSSAWRRSSTGRSSTGRSSYGRGSGQTGRRSPRSSCCDAVPQGGKRTMARLRGGVKTALPQTLTTLRKRIAGFEAQTELAAPTDFPPGE